MNNINSNKNPQIDRLTVIAISAIAISFTVAFHEGIHALVCILVGGNLKEYSALYVNCDCAKVWQAKTVAGSASIGNLILGFIFWGFLRASTNKSSETKYFFWLMMLLNWVYGAGYWAFSGVANVGDWAEVIKGAQPAWLWHLIMAAWGFLIYMYLVVLALRELGKIIGGTNGEQLKRARKLGALSYLTVIAVVLLAGLFYRAGFFSLPVMAGLAAAVGATSPLIWMMWWFRADRFAKQPGAPLEIHRRWGWVGTACVVVVLYAVVLGRTIYF